MMDPDDLVIIGNEFTMNVEEELPQHPTAPLVDKKLTMCGLVPKIPSPAPSLANKDDSLCYGCGAWDVSRTRHDRFIHPKSPAFESTRHENLTSVEGQCRPEVGKAEPESLKPRHPKSLEPVITQLPIHLSHRDQISHSESLNNARRFSPPVRYDPILEIGAY
jgi:hypothetical protein